MYLFFLFYEIWHYNIEMYYKYSPNIILHIPTLLGFDFDRTGQRSSSHWSKRLNAYCVYGVRRKLRDCGQLAVVYHLRVPGRFRLIGVGREEHFIALEVEM